MGIQNRGSFTVCIRDASGNSGWLTIVCKNIGFVEMLNFDTMFDLFSWQEGFHPSLPHPEDVLRAGLTGVLWFFIRTWARSLSQYGGTTTAGHRPRECPEVECGERRIVREREEFPMKLVEQTTIQGDFEWIFSWFRSEPYWFMSVSTEPKKPFVMVIRTF